MVVHGDGGSLMVFLDRVDPDLRAPLATLVGHDFSDLGRARAAALERRERAARADTRPGPPVVISDLWVPRRSSGPPIRVRQIKPAGPTAAALIWIHGGGHIMGDAGQDDAFVSQLASAAACSVFSVDVRLAPEFPYPAALNDTVMAFDWVRENAKELGLDADLVAVGGASAGGGIAAALTLRARDEGSGQPCFQLLVYPMLDDRTGPAGTRFDLADTGAWSPQSNRFAWSAYLRDLGTDAPPYAAPSRAASLADLAPGAVFVGDLDLFYGEAVDYARRLRAAGVPAGLHVYHGAFHGFNVLAPTAPISMRFNSDIFDALTVAFARKRLEALS